MNSVKKNYIKVYVKKTYVKKHEKKTYASIEMVFDLIVKQNCQNEIKEENSYNSILNKITLKLIYLCL